MGVHRPKEVILVNDCGIIWPGSILTPAGMHNFDLKSNNDNQKQGEQASACLRHTTVQRGKIVALETSEPSNTPGLSSCLMGDVVVGVIHRARRAAKCSGPGGGRFAAARRDWKVVAAGCLVIFAGSSEEMSHGVT